MNRSIIIDGKMVDLMCDFCENLFKSDWNKCLAFPEGIPEIILSGQFDHNNHFPGDNGILFSVSSEKAK